MKALLIFSLFVLSITASAVHAENTSNMIVHRENAGMLDEHGWVLAESTDGKFSVQLPSLYTDATIVDGDSVLVQKVYTVGSTTKDGVRFSANRIIYRKSDYASSIIEKTERGEGIPGVIVGIEKLQHLGLRAVYVLSWSPVSFISQCVLLVGEDIITLIISGPNEKLDSIKAAGERFISSLRVQ